MADTFSRVGNLNSGYDPEQVDEFLIQAKEAYDEKTVASQEPDGGSVSATIDESTVRNVAFDWVRDGYDPALVDAALDRLEAAFIQRRRARVTNVAGEEKWLNQTYSEATTLYPRLLRPEGERFANASGRGYKKADVDELLDRITRYFDGNEELTSSQIRRSTFGSARGSRAYDEAVVDVYLDRAISVLLAVE